MAKVTKQTIKVPKVVPIEYEDKVIGVTLELTNEEAQELRTVLGHVSDGCGHITSIRQALILVNITYQFNKVTGYLSPYAK